MPALETILATTNSKKCTIFRLEQILSRHRTKTSQYCKIPLPTTKKWRRQKKNKSKMKSSHLRWLILDCLLYLYFENFDDINQVGKKDISWQHLILTIEEHKTKGSTSTWSDWYYLSAYYIFDGVSLQRNLS